MSSVNDVATAADNNNDDYDINILKGGGGTVSNNNSHRRCECNGQCYSAPDINGMPASVYCGRTSLLRLMQSRCIRVSDEAQREMGGLKHDGLIISPYIKKGSINRLLTEGAIAYTWANEHGRSHEPFKLHSEIIKTCYSESKFMSDI